MRLGKISDKIYQSLRFNLLKGIPLLITVATVFFTYNFFSFEDYANIQSDYALHSFAVLVFSLGFNVVSQLIGSTKMTLLNEFKMMIILYLFFLVILNLFFPKDWLLRFLEFNQHNKSLIYGWPFLILQNMVSLFFLGRKNYTYYFLIPIINNGLFLIGVLLFYLCQSYEIIFIPSIAFSMIIYAYICLTINYRHVSYQNIVEIIHLWRRNVLPVFSSFLGLKNINYFIITFLSKEFFGILKIIRTVFSLLNFILSSETTIFINNSIKKGGKVLNDAKTIKSLKLNILLFNVVFCLLCYLVNNYIYAFFHFDFSTIICFSIINMLNLIFVLDNQIMFVAEKNSLRVYIDVIIFCVVAILFYCVNNFFGITDNLYLMGILMAIYMLNYFLSTYFYYHYRNRL